MTINIDEECIKLIQIIDDVSFDFLEFNNTNIFRLNPKEINFLWRVLNLSTKYPQVESYLKNLLNHFTVVELKNVFVSWSILHYMCRFPSHISLNSFEIIINYCMNINIKTINNSTAAHLLFHNQCNNHVYNILNLLIKYSLNLNIVNSNNRTVLDLLVYLQNELNEETKKCIIAIVDCGGTRNDPTKSGVIYDFIEYCKCLTIKPAIKNENKI